MQCIRIYSRITPILRTITAVSSCHSIRCSVRSVPEESHILPLSWQLSRPGQLPHQAYTTNRTTATTRGTRKGEHSDKPHELGTHTSDSSYFKEHKFKTPAGFYLHADIYPGQPAARVEPRNSGTQTAPGDKSIDTGKGEVVVLIHGGGQTRKAWENTAKKLSSYGHTVICLDQRGHGQSDWTDNYDLTSFAHDLHAVLVQLESRPVVVGASLGGLAALISEGEIEKVAKAVVLVDIAPRMEPAGAQRVLDFMSSTLDGFTSLQEAAQAVSAYLPHRPRDNKGKSTMGGLSGLEKNLRLDQDGRYRWHWDPAFLRFAMSPHFVSAGSRYHDPTWQSTSNTTSNTTSGSSNSTDAGKGEGGDGRMQGLTESERQQVQYLDRRLQDAARALSQPTLLIRGQMSDLVSTESVEEFVTLVPHAEYVNVEKAHHMVAGDRNDVFTEAVTAFISRLPRE